MSLIKPIAFLTNNLLTHSRPGSMLFSRSLKNDSEKSDHTTQVRNERSKVLKTKQVVTLECHRSPQAIEQNRQDNDVAIISLNEPITKNALGYEQVSQLSEIVTDIRGNHMLRVCILRSLVQDIFCAGANLKQRAKMSQHELWNWLQTQRDVVDKLYNIPIPTLAAIDGYALGGGLEYALSCDMIVVNEDAKVGLVETRLGIIPGAGGTQRLTRRIGPSKAKELIFTGRMIDGNAAYRFGIANAIAAGPDGAYKRALELAYEITDKSPLSLRLAKLAINKGSEVDMASGLDIEQACYGQLLPAKDRLEGLKAFLEKRKPVFNGE